VAKTQGTFRVWDAASCTPLFSNSGQHATLSADGQRVAAAALVDEKSYAVVVYEVTSGREVARFPVGEERSFAFSPDGRRILAAHTGETEVWAVDAPEERERKPYRYRETRSATWASGGVRFVQERYQGSFDGISEPSGFSHESSYFVGPYPLLRGPNSAWLNLNGCGFQLMAADDSEFHLKWYQRSLTLPLWFLAEAFALVPGGRAIAYFVRSRRSSRDPNRCRARGYDVLAPRAGQSDRAQRSPEAA